MLELWRCGQMLPAVAWWIDVPAIWALCFFMPFDARMNRQNAPGQTWSILTKTQYSAEASLRTRVQAEQEEGLVLASARKKKKHRISLQAYRRAVLFFFDGLQWTLKQRRRAHVMHVAMSC
jgi:hypothetical protein